MKIQKILGLALAVVVSTSSLVASDAAMTEREEMSIEQIAEKTGVVEIRLLLYKNKNELDPMLWQRLIELIVDFVNKNDDEKNADLKEFLLRLIKFAEESRTSSSLNGELSIATASGVCPQKCCGTICTCPSRYAGICPCGLRNSGNEGDARCCAANC